MQICVQILWCCSHPVWTLPFTTVSSIYACVCSSRVDWAKQNMRRSRQGVTVSGQQFYRLFFVCDKRYVGKSTITNMFFVLNRQSRKCQGLPSKNFRGLQLGPVVSRRLRDATALLPVCLCGLFFPTWIEWLRTDDRKLMDGHCCQFSWRQVDHFNQKTGWHACGMWHRMTVQCQLICVRFQQQIEKNPW